MYDGDQIYICFIDPGKFQFHFTNELEEGDPGDNLQQSLLTGEATLAQRGRNYNSVGSTNLSEIMVENKNWEKCCCYVD